MPTDDEPIEATGKATTATVEPDPAPATEPEEPTPEEPSELAHPDDPPAYLDPDGLSPRTAVGSALQGLSVIPPETEMRALAQLANTLAHADACPKPMRRKPNDVFLVLLTARDLGTAITTALREFHVIEGRVTLSPKVKLAMVRSRPDLGQVRPAPDNNALHATWFSRRADGGGVEVASTFTWDDAQLAGLVDSRCTPYEHWREERTGGRNSSDCLCKDNWKRYPKRMLSWRALGYLLDDEYPEIGTGLYSPDELGAVTDADGEPIEVRAVESLPGMKGGGQGSGADDPLADEATRADLQARLDAVKAAAPDAVDELKAWWAERDLPPVSKLPERKVGLVDARLAHVEKQHSIERPPAGEAPPADQNEDPDDLEGEGDEETGQDGPEEPPAPQGTPDPSPEPEGGPEAASGEPGTDAAALEDSIEGGQARRVTDDPDTWAPTSPPGGDVAGWLIERANAMNAASVKTAYTVAGLEPPRGNVQALRKSWAVWQFDLIARAVVNVLAVAFGVPGIAPAAQA